jgi:hypothetical protein
VFPWFLIKISNLTSFEAFNEYKQIVPNESAFNKIILKKSPTKSRIVIKKEEKELPCLSVIYTNNETQKFEIYKPEEGLFCYCKKPFLEGDFMVGMF